MGGSIRLGIFRVAVEGDGCGGLTMITLRLGVDGSFTPWAQAAAGTTSANMIKTKRFMCDISRAGTSGRRTPFLHGCLPLPRHGNQLAIPPDALGRPSGRKAPRHISDRGRPGRGLGSLRLFRRRCDDAGTGGVGLIFDPLRRSGLNQEGQETDCRQNAAHGQTPEKMSSAKCHRFLPKSKLFETIAQDLCRPDHERDPPPHRHANEKA